MDTSFLNGLNPEQLHAATIVNGYERMLAGAGTGKTHTLITRVAYLIESGVNPAHILLLTFTRKAADEMKNRLIEYVGMAGMQVTANTFHSFIIDMLRSHQKMLGLPDDFRVLDKADEKTLLSHMQNGYFEDKNYSKAQKKEFPKSTVLLEIIGLSINKQEPLDMIIANHGNETLEKYQKEVIEILDQFQNKKSEEHYYGFDDLLQVFLDCLNQNPEFYQRIQALYTHVMCDEYQDTNVIQEMILNRLTEVHENFCVVGDDNQSIYRFRAAEIQNILTFDERYPLVESVQLIRNYRSTQEILDVSNTMMTHATEGIPKVLVGKTHGEKPKYTYCKDEKAASEHIYDLVMQRYEQEGIPLKEQCVLVRKANVSNLLEQLCTKNHLPYRKVGGQKFLEMHNVKCVLNFLRLSVNDKDELAWRGILSEYQGMGQKGIEQIIGLAKVYGVDVVLRPSQYLAKSVRIQTALAPFFLFWQNLQRTCTVAEKLSVIATHYANLLENQLNNTNSTDKMERISKWQKDLPDQIRSLTEMAEDSRSVTNFLDMLSLDGLKEMNATDDMLTISTIHSAKGLEWDCVYLYQPVEQLFHDWGATEEDLAEELRVMYVALTRAKKHLDLIQSAQMLLNRRMEPTMMSSFLQHPDVMQTMEFERL